jgi:hypothetical protein
LGIEVVTVSTTTPSVDPLATTKHYIVDMSTATGDITLNLPALAAGSVIELSIINNKTNGYRATLHAAGSDTIAYDDVTTYTDAKVVYPNVWLRLVSRTTYWVVEDCSMPLTGTFSGSLEITGFTALGQGNSGLKCKLLTGTTAGSEGTGTSVAHGLTLSKIVSVSGVIQVSASLSISIGWPVGVGAGYESSIAMDETNLTVNNSAASSENILSKTFYVTVCYIQ